MKFISCMFALACGLTVLPASAQRQIIHIVSPCESIPIEVRADVFEGNCPVPEAIGVSPRL